jgi:hypothetical protein
MRQKGSVMRESIILLTLLGVAGCNQAADNPTANATNTAAAGKPKPKYCFFKESETKAWSASRDKDGNVVVKGKAYRSDPRYQARLGEAEVNGVTATVRPSITQNATGYAAPENWWDVSATVPNSSAVDTVIVECGPKTLAELKVPPEKS